LIIFDKKKSRFITTLRFLAMLDRVGLLAQFLEILLVQLFRAFISTIIVRQASAATLVLNKVIIAPHLLITAILRI